MYRKISGKIQCEISDVRVAETIFVIFFKILKNVPQGPFFSEELPLVFIIFFLHN